MQKHGPWTIHHSETMYQDPWLKVARDQVTRPDDQPGTYATVELKSGVCVIALTERAEVHLTREFHYAVGRNTIEGVSGGIEVAETPLVAAKRELEEELGLRAASWTHLARIDPFTAAIRSTVDLYVARDLTECPESPEGTELIQRVTLPLADAVERVRTSEISHAPTCVALLRLALDEAELS